MRTLILLIGIFCAVIAGQHANAQWQQMETPNDFSPHELVELDGYLFMLKTSAAYRSLYRSSDNGASWKVIDGNFPEEYLRDLSVCLSNIIVSGKQGFYVSGDYGDTWLQRDYPDMHNRIAFTVYNDLIVYATVDSINVTTDVGNSWTGDRNKDRMWSHYAPTSHGDSLFIPAYSHIVLLTTQNGIKVDTIPTPDRLDAVWHADGRLIVSTDSGLYYSVDQGANWSGLTSLMEPVSYMTSDDQYIYGLHQTLNRVYRIDKSTFALDSLSIPGLELPEDHHMRGGYSRFEGVKVIGTELYVLTTGKGLMRTTDKGATWIECNGTLNGARIEGFAEMNGDLFAAAGVTGLVKSTDGGTTWEHVDYQGHPFDAFGVVTNSQSVYAFNWAMDVVHSTTSGNSWSLVSTPQAPYDSLWVSGSNALLATETRLFMTTNNLKISDDNGASWTEVPFVGRSPLKKRNGAVFACILNGLAWTSDNGVTWDSTKFGTTPVYPDYDVQGNTILAVFRDSVYSSPDMGQTWTTYPSPGYKYAGVMEVFGVNGNFLVSYSDRDSIYITTNAGASWTPFMSGIDDMVTAFYAYGQYLYAGTLSSGIWRITAPPSVIVAAEPVATVSQLALAQNYPNPVSGNTTIRYTLPSSAHVTLSVTNALGREVARIVDTRIEAGSHNAPFNTAGLQPGMYFYTLRSGTATVTKSMLVTR